MDAILGFRPQTRIAIVDMDRKFLESALSAIVRSHQELGALETTLDAINLGGIRCLADPFDLLHICRALVRSLIAEGFNAFRDKSNANCPYTVKIS
jgi:hypothetical protein